MRANSAGSNDSGGASGAGEGVEGARGGERGGGEGSSGGEVEERVGSDTTNVGRRLLEQADKGAGSEGGRVEEASEGFGVRGPSGRKLLSVNEEDDFWAACDAVNGGNCR